MNINFWKGDLIRLRAVEPEDWKHFFQWREDTYFQQTTDRITFPRSQEAVKRWAADCALAEPKDDAYRWVIENHEGEFVGTINTYTCDPRHGTLKYGLGIRREYWRRGYATEAIRIVLRYFFEELRYQKANVQVYDFNQGSVDLHRRLGFQEEGRLRRMGYSQGQYYDWIVMGVTREEFGAVERQRGSDR